MAKKLSAEAVQALRESSTTDNTLSLTKISPRLYAEMKPFFEALEARWDRRAELHIFPDNAWEAIMPVIVAGGLYADKKKDLGQFDTPADLAREVAQIADIKPGMEVLEPSCGVGNLIAAILEENAQVYGYEIDEGRVYTARKRHPGVVIFQVDFLKHGFVESRFDRIVMNPPFAKQADIDHVTHALKLLKPGGRLVAIMGAGAEFRDTKKYRDFRDTSNMTITKLPEDSFKESGTRVNTVLVEIDS